MKIKSENNPEFRENVTKKAKDRLSQIPTSKANKSKLYYLIVLFPLSFTK
jgi:hypothetical protein